MTDSESKIAETAPSAHDSRDHGATSASGDPIDPYVLRGGASTTVEKIALKHGDTFMLTDARGDMPVSEQETGLYWHGTRFLRICDLFVEGLPMVALSHSISDEEGACQIDLTNPFLPLPQDQGIYQGVVHLRRRIELRSQQLTQTFLLTSFEPSTVDVRVGLKTGADFRDIFEVRGMERTARGEMLPPRIEHDEVVFCYRGLDGIERKTHIVPSLPADRVVNGGIFWQLRLERGETVQLQVEVTVSERRIDDARIQTASPESSRNMPALHMDLPGVQSDNVFFNRVLARGMHDLIMMCTPTAEGLYPYGGIPWYACPFGRDALITSLEFLPWFPEVARGTLAFLIAHQGQKEDPFTEEEPGRILHEYRTGEMANCREIPFIPYYGSIDATPLFLMLFEAYIRWTNDMVFLKAYWANAQAAAQWMQKYGDRDGDTFLEYEKTSETGLVNQGWKDSWDSISYRDGCLGEPPIALCEVQGYAYAAYRAMSYLSGRLGKHDEREYWRKTAETLQMNFLRSFWWEEEYTFYIALDGEKRPCDVVASNAGHCLWSGIVPEEWGQPVVERLLADDMYTEWGIRTLSAREQRYNPMSYHNGSVWPHDTALVGAGLARLGRKREAGELLGHLYGVSLYYDGARLPELFCGFTRRRGFGPTRYPVACSPQSWAAGAPFMLLSSVLGFEPEAERHRLMLHKPMLPDWLNHLELRGLRLGDRYAHLHFARMGNDTVVTLTGDMGIDIHVLPE
ncbi:MAG TPA: glycogen debranching N-terminal domain-containing protein [Ktedonobacterales bacterium]|nr:glycogen debranching N-terminal domain-containing protein [Ktedonobacterales bacterium]